MQNNQITQDGVTYDLKTDNKGAQYWCVTDYNNTSHTLIIPNEIDDIPVKEIASLAFNCCLDLRTLEINCEIIKLQPYAISNCRNLSLLTFHKLDRIKAEPLAITNPDVHFVVVATTSCKGDFKIDAFTTYAINKIFRKNLAVKK